MRSFVYHYDQVQEKSKARHSIESNQVATRLVYRFIKSIYSSKKAQFPKAAALSLVSFTHRKPIVALLSIESAIKIYFPCSSLR